MTKRNITKSEKTLWQFITRRDTVYNISKEDILFDVDIYADDQLQKIEETCLPDREPKRSPSPLPPLEKGKFAGVEKRQAERLKKGKLAIDAVIDLHGMTQEEAFEALMEFMHDALQREKRVLHVITGKGKNNQGALRQQFSHWLNEPVLRPFILAFDQAAPKDGGDGAFYILLKKTALI